MTRQWDRFTHVVSGIRTQSKCKPRLTLHALEERTVPTVYLVTDAGDSLGSPGIMTLRDAITQSNTDGGTNEIDFDTANLFATPQTITLDSALPDITSDLTIKGDGAANLTVTRNPTAGAFGIFRTYAGNTTFDSMTISGGSATSGYGSGITASVNNTTVNKCVIKDNNGDNFATGGGIYVPSGQSGILTVTDSTISGNTGYTGGIYFFSAGNLLVDRCTISGNVGTSTIAYHGGGIIFYGTIGAKGVTIQNSTISGNTTDSSAGGGGINFDFMTGTATIQNCTITDNIATYAALTGGGGVGLSGSASGSVIITSSVIARNTGTSAAPDLYNLTGTVSGDNNLIGVDPGNFAGTGNQMGTQATPLDPQLGVLADNGGPTWTELPEAGSPVLGVGSNPASLSIDQRGFPRQTSTGIVDIGAVQLASATPTITVDAGQTNPTNVAASVDFHVQFDQGVTGFDYSQIDFAGSTATGTLLATVNPLSPTDYTVTVTGMTSDGTVVASVLAGTGSQGLNAAGQNNMASTGAATITIDTVAPTVTINQSGNVDPTNTTIAFDVVFSEPVIGFGSSDVTLTSTVGGTAVVTPVGVLGDKYTVTVTGMNGVGTVKADIAAGKATDFALNPNAASTSTDNTVNFDNVAPTVTLTQHGTPGPVGGTAVTFDVVFSEPVVGFGDNIADVDLTGTTAPGATANVTGSGTNYTITVSGMTGDGTVQVAIPAGACTDPAGNVNSASSAPVAVPFTYSGTIQFASATYSQTEHNSPTITITVQRVGGSSGPLSVDYATNGGTATPGATKDYDAISGTFNWLAGDTTDRQFTIQIHDDQIFEGDETVDLILSNISLNGALGTPATSVLTITDYEEGTLSFSTPKFFVAEDGSVKKTITVSRTLGSNGTVGISYATSDGTAISAAAGANPKDYSSAAGTLSWGDGDSTDKTFDVPINDDTLNEGNETVGLTLNTPTGNALTGILASTLNIQPSDGLPAGTFTDSDGDAVTIKLAKPKTDPTTLLYYRTDPDGDTKGPIELIALGNSTIKAGVTIKVKAPKTGGTDGRVGLGEITGVDLKSLGAKSANLNGVGIHITGNLGGVTVADIADGAEIKSGPLAVGSKLKTSVTAKVIGNNVTIDVGTPLTSLKAWSFGTGSIVAPSIGGITISGNKKNPTVVGNFGADITVSGVGVDIKKNALNSLKVAGKVSGSNIKVGGNVGTVTVGTFDTSRLFANFTGTDLGVGTFLTPSTITSFSTKDAANSFAHSFVIASNFKGVSLASADTANGGNPFGFVFKNSFAKLAVKASKLSYNTKTGGTQTLAGDLEVIKV
ncbi:MAG TPA: Calx-beta domain-containing protein [Gemmataceae bacterium]|jgi:hypothetical protein|nr:Calx-beta domain-containing protein [Gemmataceae bacterium]